MYSLSILPPAIQDLKEAAAWDNIQQNGLGHLFLKRIREKGHFIQSFPFACPVRYGVVHVSKVDQFPFLIHYQIVENKPLIVIFAILHTSRNPKSWNERMIG
jgi:hypothetical protein